MKYLSFNIIYFCFFLCLLTILSCNNPFSTRNPQKPTSESGAAIKPPTSPENVLYNFRIALENMSIQDYMDVYSSDFIFSPDSDDSLKYEQEFTLRWGFEKEQFFAENYLQRNIIKKIEVYPSYEYKPGLDAYEYNYWVIVTPADSTKSQYDIKGRARIYLDETQDGKWKIFRWIELMNMIGNSYYTLGIIKAMNI